MSTSPLAGVAFVFPGQGSQAVGMGQDAYDAFANVRALFAEADDALGYSLSQIVLKGPADALRQTANTQPAILLISVALYRELGLTPSSVAGHSLGEYSALVAAGALTFHDAIRLVHKRGQYMQEAVPDGRGVMLALIGAEDEQVRAAVEQSAGAVDIANYNAPGQIVIAGERHATEAAASQAGARQIIPLPVSAPFHCRLMQPAEERLRAALAEVSFRELTIPLYNNVDARRVTTAHEARLGLERQVSRPVRWTQVVQAMIAYEQVQTFVEVGPGNVLVGLIRRIDRSAQRHAVNSAESVANARAALTAG